MDKFDKKAHYLIGHYPIMGGRLREEISQALRDVDRDAREENARTRGILAAALLDIRAWAWAQEVPALVQIIDEVACRLITIARAALEDQ